jgi:hypothetical protein
VVQTCNPNHLVGRDQEDGGSWPAQAKSSWDPISTNGWDRVVQAYYPSYLGKHKWEACGSCWSGHKMRPYLKYNQYIKGRGVAHWQIINHASVRSSEFNSQYCHTKKGQRITCTEFRGREIYFLNVYYCLWETLMLSSWALWKWIFIYCYSLYFINFMLFIT